MTRTKGLLALALLLAGAAWLTTRHHAQDPLATARLEADGDRADEIARERSEESRHERFSKMGDAGDESMEARTAAEQFAQARTAPGIVMPGAYGAAFASLSGLPVTGGAWTEVTNRPYDSDDPRYRDPAASNSGGGALGAGPRHLDPQQQLM